ncbi:MAG: efflux RND transporter permease subunit, partial [Lachnospiraceae bacterium]|nr:efflux RND transporter permease subunit [Lachnospiraceae bacterium]
MAVSGRPEAGLSLGDVTRVYNDHLLTDLEGIEGVARVEAQGLLEETVEVVINEQKIDKINSELMTAIKDKFSDAEQEIADAENELKDGQEKLDEGLSQAADQMANAETIISQQQAQITEAKAQIGVWNTVIDAASNLLDQAEQEYNDLDNRVKSADAEIERLRAESSEADALIEELTPQIEALNKTAEEIGAKLADVTEKISQISSADEITEDMQKELTELQTLANQYTEQLQTLAGEIASKQAQIDEASQQSAQKTQRITELIAEREALKALRDSDELGTRIAEGRAAIADAQAQIASLTSQIESGQITLSQAQAQLSSSKAMAIIQASVNSIKITEGLAQIETAKQQLDDAMQTAMDSASLDKMLTVDTVKGLLTAQNFSMPAGYVSEDGTDYLVRVGDELTSIESLENLILADLTDQGLYKIYLKDVADVVKVDNADEIYAKLDGSDGVLVSVQKQTDYSTAEVAERIRAYMDSDEVKAMGIEMVALMDQGVYIDLIVKSVLNNLIVGGILAIIILLIFLMDIRPTLIVGISIPVSVVFALVLMYFTGITMNIISLSGLALGVGMLVDNSIVVIENIYRLRHEGMDRKKAAVMGAKQVTGAIIASTLTTICIWIPIVFVEGFTRQIFMDLVLTIAYSLLASLIVALTVVPAASAGLLRKTGTKKNTIFTKIDGGYAKLLRHALKYKAIVVIAAFVLFVISVFAVIPKGFEFMGETDSQQVTVTINLPDGSVLSDAAEVGDQAMERIMALESVQSVGVMSGGSGLTMLTAGSGATQLSMYVILHEDRTETSQEVARRIQEVTADLDCEVKANGSAMDLSMLGGSGMSVMVKGRDIDTLIRIADDVAEMLEDTEGAVNVSNGHTEPSPEFRISVNKEKAIAHGLTVANVYMQIAAKIQNSGAATTLVTENGEYDIVVVSHKDSTMTRDDLRELTFEAVPLTGGDPQTVSLAEIAEFSDAEGLATIMRDSQMRYINVTSEIADGYNATVLTREFENKVKDYDLPSGYSIELNGENETVMESLKELIKLLLIGVAIVYLIMVAQFQSLLSPFIVMFTIPLAFTGGLLGLFLTGNIISVISMIGFVMLAGVIVNNGIVFIDYTNQLRAEGMSTTEALIETGRTRLRPILMTALTTILAMSTMALGIGEGTDMVQPMAIVTIGGLIYGTLLTLFVVPSIYVMFHSDKRRLRKEAGRAAKMKKDPGTTDPAAAAGEEIIIE